MFFSFILKLMLAGYDMSVCMQEIPNYIWSFFPFLYSYSRYKYEMLDEREFQIISVLVSISPVALDTILKYLIYLRTHDTEHIAKWIIMD